MAVAAIAGPGLARMLFQLIRLIARENMANFKVPRVVTFLPELPHTPLGKVHAYYHQAVVLFYRLNARLFGLHT